MRDHFDPGARYKVDDFVARCRTALTAASERVRERYGTPCSIAMREIAQIEAAATRYDPAAEVVFKSFKE